MQPSVLAKRIEEITQAGSPTDTGNTPGEVLAGILAKLEEQHMQPLAQEDPTNWAKQALNRVRDFVGTGDDEGEINEWRKTKLTRALSAAANKLAEQWDQKLSQDLFALTENPGARVAAAESALDKLQVFFHKQSEALKDAVSQESGKTTQCWAQVESALQECVAGGGGFRLFGGRSKNRQLRAFMDQLAHYARQRLNEEILGAVRHGFGLLAGKLAERSRDMGFVRQRLRHLQENLESLPVDPDEETANTRPGADYTMTRSPIPSTESFWEAIRQSETARVVLPDGETDLERAALRFLQRLPPDLWTQLDKELYERVLSPRGGLHGACTNSGDMTRQLAEPLLVETSNFLGQHLPIMDVAQILGTEFGYLPRRQEPRGPTRSAPDLGRQVHDYMERARPAAHRPGKWSNKQSVVFAAAGQPRRQGPRNTRQRSTPSPTSATSGSPANPT